jgi:hypothetical protein
MLIQRICDYPQRGRVLYLKKDSMRSKKVITLECKQ